MVLQIPKYKLNDGNQIPALGLGTAVELSREEGFDVNQLNDVPSVVKEAIALGYRHIDSAHIYRTEKPIGEGLKECFQKGLVKREEVFITTKLWHHKHEPKDVEPALRESLKKLGLAYVDLYLMHWPLSYTAEGKILNIDYVDTWKAMEKVKELGLAKSIGVSNFNEEQLTRLLANCKVKPVTNQLEVNLNNQVPSLTKLCKEHNILVTAYTPFGSTVGYRAKLDNDRVTPATHPVLVNLSKKYNKTIAQILLRFLVEQQYAVIPMTGKKDRLIENASIFDFKLTEEEMNTLYKFDTNYRTIAEPWWANHPNFPFVELRTQNCPPIPKDLLC